MAGEASSSKAEHNDLARYEINGTLNTQGFKQGA
jgi:hypothetical protein